MYSFLHKEQKIEIDLRYSYSLRQASNVLSNLRNLHDYKNVLHYISKLS